MGLFDFASFRRSVASLEEQLQKMQNEENVLRNELAQINSAPSSREDLKQMLSQWVASNAAKYRQSLRETLLKFTANPRNFNPRNLLDIMSISGVAHPGGEAVRTQDVDQALCALFAPLLSKALQEEVDAMEWSENAITIEKRSAAAAALETRIHELNRQIEELSQQAADAGIVLNQNGGRWK
jgi:cell division protein FtsB